MVKERESKGYLFVSCPGVICLASSRSCENTAVRGGWRTAEWIRVQHPNVIWNHAFQAHCHTPMEMIRRGIKMSPFYISHMQSFFLTLQFDVIFFTLAPKNDAIIRNPALLRYIIF